MIVEPGANRGQGNHPGVSGEGAVVKLNKFTPEQIREFHKKSPEERPGKGSDAPASSRFQSAAAIEFRGLLSQAQDADTQHKDHRRGHVARGCRKANLLIYTNGQ
jgi:hypothetical protein